MTPREVSHVADLVHAEAGIDTALDRWEEQYRLAIAEGPAPLAEVVAAASAHLVKLKALTFHFERDHGRLLRIPMEAHVADMTASARARSERLRRNSRHEVGARFSIARLAEPPNCKDDPARDPFPKEAGTQDPRRSRAERPPRSSRPTGVRNHPEQNE